MLRRVALLNDHVSARHALAFGFVDDPADLGGRQVCAEDVVASEQDGRDEGQGALVLGQRAG